MDDIPKEYFKYALWAGLGLAAIAEHKMIDLVYNTLGRDLRQGLRMVKLLAEYKKLQRQNKTVPQYFYETVQKFGDKVTFLRVFVKQTEYNSFLAHDNLC